MATSVAATGTGEMVLAESQNAVEFLSRPQAYPERPSGVARIETHISHVFVTDRYVYKLKKPVRYEFVDFSTIQLRQAACREELRLNRRLAADVYLDMLPVTRGPSGRLTLAGAGPAVDWVVKMRRLPADRMLDRLILEGRLTDGDVAALADYLARFYLHAPPLTVRPEEHRRAIERHVRANRGELLEAEHQLPPALVRRVHAAQLRLLVLWPELFDARVCDGRIVDGHGDLRPEHICLESRPAVFDCVEFSADLRAVDVADELSFLAAECAMLDAPQVGQRVLDAYLKASGDRPPGELLAFYQTYRASVRAKVAALRGRQQTAAERTRSRELATRYLQLADRRIATLGPPLVLVVGGVAGTGKTTLADQLAETFGLANLRTDVVREHLFGTCDEAAYDQGQYDPASRQRVYDELFVQAERVVAGREGVVLDGTFLSAAHLSRIATIVGQHGLQLLHLRCECPLEVAEERIRLRRAAAQDQSQAQPEIVARQLARQQPPPPDVPWLAIDSTAPPAAQLAAACERLRAIARP